MTNVYVIIYVLLTSVFVTALMRWSTTKPYSPLDISKHTLPGRIAPGRQEPDLSQFQTSEETSLRSSCHIRCTTVSGWRSRMTGNTRSSHPLSESSEKSL